MIANDVIDFFMEQLLLPDVCDRKIRQTVKDLARLPRSASLGHRMLTDQLIDVLFDLYAYGGSDVAELGTALKSKLNRYIHSHFVPSRQAGIILAFHKDLRSIRASRHITNAPGIY